MAEPDPEPEPEPRLDSCRAATRGPTPAATGNHDPGGDPEMTSFFEMHKVRALKALRLSYGIASRLARVAPDEALVVHDSGVRGRFDVPANFQKEYKRTHAGPVRDWTIQPGTPVSRRIMMGRVNEVLY